MEAQLTFTALLITAITAGVWHTMIGPDHYLPFVALSKARNWSYAKTVLTTVICGIAHVLSSVIIGFAGLAIGSSVGFLEGVESGRADIVKWLILGFAVAYFIYGIRKAINYSAHEHDGEVHSHSHGGVAHSHKKVSNNPTTFWLLFILFAFGPCEVLIPLLMYPAASFDWTAVVAISLAFSAATILTMLSFVTVFYFGLKILPLRLDGFARRYSHAISGAVIAGCAALMFLGL